MINPDDRAADLQAVSAGSVPGEGSATGIWLVTFADLVLLLLAFFVMLFSMSSPDTEALKKAAALLSTRSTIPIAPETAPAPATANTASVVPPRAAAAEYLSAVLRDGLDRIRPLRDAGVTLSGDAVILTPPPGLLEPADSSPPAPPLATTGEDSPDPTGLADLALLLDRLDNSVLVVATATPFEPEGATATPLEPEGATATPPEPEGATATPPEPEGATATSASDPRQDAWDSAVARAAAAANRLRAAGFTRALSAQARLPEAKAASNAGLTLWILGEGDTP